VLEFVEAFGVSGEDRFGHRSNHRHTLVDLACVIDQGLEGRTSEYCV